MGLFCLFKNKLIMFLTLCGAIPNISEISPNDNLFHPPAKSKPESNQKHQKGQKQPIESILPADADVYN
ncbi:MAG: hypothetical protein ACFE96_11865, partial [Candidatus Hermodarchaeota archaeon]